MKLILGLIIFFGSMEGIANVDYLTKTSCFCLAPVISIEQQLLKGTLKKMVSGETDFVPKNEIERRISDLLNIIIDEHNSNISVEDKTNRLVKSRFVIMEARDKFIQEGGKLWSRVLMAYEDGHTQDYIFKQEYAYAMDEIGYYILKILGVAASYTRRYSDNLFLIKPIGQFNLGKIRDVQYQNPEFMQELSLLSGRAAARAFVVGLADRKAENMRVILNEQGMPKEVINADLASIFVHKDIKYALMETFGILINMITAATNADVSNEEIAQIINMFLEGFEEQMKEFQNDCESIIADFEKINPDMYEKFDRMWGIMNNVRSRAKAISARIDPQILKFEQIRYMLLSTFLNKISSTSLVYKRADFMNQIFKEKGVLFFRMQSLFLLLNENNDTVLKENSSIFEEIFETFDSMAVSLSKKEHYLLAIMCDNLCIKTGKKLISINQVDSQMWQTRISTAEIRLQEAINKATIFSINFKKYEPQDFLERMFSQSA